MSFFDKSVEWWASRSDPRFTHYREARLAYESCLREVGKSFEELEAADYARWRDDSRLREAEPHYRAAIALCRESNELKNMGTALYQLGMLLHLQGRLEEAGEAFQAALSLQQGFAQTGPEVQKVASGCHYYAGIIAMKQGRMREARSHLETSLRIDEVLGDLQGGGMTRRALARVMEGPTGAAENSSATRQPQADYLPDPAWTPKRATPVMGLDPGHGGKTKGEATEERIPARFSLSEDALWVVSLTAGTNAFAMDSIKRFQNQFPRKCVISQISCEATSGAPATPPPIAQDERLAAAVLVIEPGSLNHEEFQYWARWCIGLVAGRDDFRLFVCLHGLSRQAFDELAKRPRDPAGSLADELNNTVQFAGNGTVEELQEVIIPFLRDREDIRATAQWRRVRIVCGGLVGGVARAVQVMCGAALAAGALAWILLKWFKWGVPFAWLKEAPPAAVALIAGIPMFALQTVPFSLIFRDFAAWNAMLRDDPRLGRWFIWGGLLVPATVALPRELGASPAMIGLGLMTGLLFDVLRRDGLQARRAGIAVEPPLEQPSRREAEQMAADLSRPEPVHPLTCPLFPAERPAAFISYRRTPWSSEFAKSLHAQLEGLGVRSFLDRESIGSGSAWRQALNRSIADSHIFIAIVERQSKESGWMAAELIAALRSRRLTQHPQLIVLVEPSVTAEQLRGGQPVFEAVLAQAGETGRSDGVRMIPATEANVQTLLAGLAPYAFRTMSLFPHWLVIMLKLFSIPLTVLGGLGATVGLPALFFAALQQWGKFDSAAWLAAHGWLLAASLAAAYMCGFTARMAVASRYEIRHEDPPSLARAQGLAAIGLGALACAWMGRLSGLTVGWMAALGCFGWLMAWCFISGTAKVKPDFLKEAR